jgi:hypothetical protein
MLSRRRESFREQGFKSDCYLPLNLDKLLAGFSPGDTTARVYKNKAL